MGKRSGGNADIAAQLLRQSFEDAPCGVAIIDCRKKGYPIVFVDADFEGVTGYSAGEVLGRGCMSLLKNRRDPKALRELRKSVRGRKPGTAVFRVTERTAQPPLSTFPRPPCAMTPAM